MDELSGCLGGLVALIFIAAVLGVGGLLVTSHAILYKEAKSPDGSFYTCTYFTGTQTVELYSTSATGCARFVDVGK